MRTNGKLAAIICVLAIIAGHSGLFAQRLSDKGKQNVQDVIYFKNGEIIRGKIIERVEGKTIKILYAGNQIRNCAIDEIERIGREFNPEKSGIDSYRSNFGDSNIPIKTRKIPLLALIWSLAIPGGGQVYNGEYAKGIGQLTLCSVGFIFFAGYMPAGGYGNNSNIGSGETISKIGLTVYVLSALWSIIDAPMSANKINRKNSFVSVPLRNQRIQASIDNIQADGNFTPGLRLKLSF